MIFTGEVEDWPAFRDLFNSIIARDKALTEVERLQHLKTSVQREAEQLIRCFATTDENFVRAWKTVIALREPTIARQLLLQRLFVAPENERRIGGRIAEDLPRHEECRRSVRIKKH